ncbi:MAG: sulfatase [Blastopirellula sp.]|nr:sulfatase [Blastopirellula sp.]
MHPFDKNNSYASDPSGRRQFLTSAAGSVGMAALASLVGRDTNAAEGLLEQGKGRPPLPGLPHHAPKAKRVILFWQGGGPSHVDLFDDKPTLRKLAGQDIPDSVRGTTRLSTMSASYAKWPCVPAIKPHKAYGKSGLKMTEMLPNIGALADDLCLVRSMHTEAVNHAPGVTLFTTGAQVPGRPSMGAWLSYGLGSETDNLPTFVVMTSSDKGRTCGQLFFDYYWGSGFLPSRFQGVKFRNTGDLVPYLSNPPGVSRNARRALLDDMAALNQAHRAEYGDPEIDTRISQYEMAFRMQASVPELVDFSTETQSTIERYGPDALNKGTYANNCLIARRLLERGVRFVQLMHSGWDQHGNLFTQLERQCEDTDAPSAALVQDLKDRGMLDDTLVVWGGEFGRTPFGQGNPAKPAGRDHFGKAYSWWLAGGGVRPGTVYGETDEFGWNVTNDPVHVHDMQATLLHLCGIDHTRLTFRYQGRQYRLTDVHGEVVKGLLA